LFTLKELGSVAAIPLCGFIHTWIETFLSINLIPRGHFLVIKTATSPPSLNRRAYDYCKQTDCGLCCWQTDFCGHQETIDSQFILVQQLKTCNKVDIGEHLRWGIPGALRHPDRNWGLPMLVEDLQKHWTGRCCLPDFLTYATSWTVCHSAVNKLYLMRLNDHQNADIGCS
jgi:hypothetical protein